jgi:SAM-dependent methyltransferase
MSNQWDERYATDEYVYGTQPNDFVRDHVTSLPPGGRVLCLADGEGRNGVFLAQQGMNVTSVDQSSVGLAKASALAEQRGVSISTAVADLVWYDLGTEQWDAIVSVFCHLPPDLRRSVHQRVVQALRPGGVFLLEAYTPQQLTFRTGGPPTVELLMTSSSLTEELEGLDMLLNHEITRDIHEGRLHDGPSAVVQVLARKPASPND